MYNYSSMGKYCYKILPMVVINSPEIFHQKKNDFLQEFGFIYVYIDYLLVLKKGIWHIIYTKKGSYSK